MPKFIAANVKAGEDLIKLSLILIRTINPEVINKHRPIEANMSNNGLK